MQSLSHFFFFLKQFFKNVKPFLAHRLLRESPGWLIPAVLPYGEVQEKRKVHGGVDMGFSLPTKSRWKLHAGKENWGPGICLSLKHKNKTNHPFTVVLQCSFPCPGQEGRAKRRELAKFTSLVRDRTGT